MKYLLLALLLAFSQPAHANDYLGPLLGAVVGGVVGNQFGSGSGQTAMTAIGAVIGSQVGSNTQYPGRSFGSCSNETYYDGRYDPQAAREYCLGRMEFLRQQRQRELYDARNRGYSGQ